MITFLLSVLLYSSPKVTFSKEEVYRYEELLLSVSKGGMIDYQLHFPKIHFLQYLSLKGNYVFHGSNNQDIETFEPREQTLYNGTKTKSVFASAEPLWSVFFAILNRSQLIGSFRNGCIVGKNKKYHFYSINESTNKNNPWTEGMLYILPKDKFMLAGHGKVLFDEWICQAPVNPIGKISVTMADFYYKNKVAVHKDNESLLKTWLFYKARTWRTRWSL